MCPQPGALLVDPELLPLLDDSLLDHGGLRADNPSTDHQAGMLAGFVTE
jgi:hypothetical protein